MKNKAMRTLSLAVALVMCFGVMSLSVNAADEYVPLLENITGNSFEGILKTSISGIGADNYYMVYDTYNTGANKDHYYYTSLDGADYDKRYLKPMPKLRSLAYGGKAGSEIGIGVLEYGTAEAYVFARDLAKSYEYDGVAVDKVYNKIYNEDKWIELHPNIYYDSYSGYFFCHGFEYTTEKTYTDLSLFYTDGTVERSTYNGAEAYILTWHRVTGDYTDNYEPVVDSASEIDCYATLAKGKSTIDGDGNGNIVVALVNGSTVMELNSNFVQKSTGVETTGNGSMVFSLIEITKTGTAPTVTANSYSLGQRICGVEMLPDGKFVFFTTDKSSAGNDLYVYEPATCKTCTTAKYAGRTQYQYASNAEASTTTKQYSVAMAEYGGSAYVLLTNGIAYKVVIDESGDTPTVSLDNLSLSELTGTAKDLEFDDNGKMLVLTDKNLYTNTLSETSGDVSALTATLLQADKNSYYFKSSAYSTDTTVRGYKIDAEMSLGVTDADQEAIYECVSEPNIFEAVNNRYPNVKGDTAPGNYDVVIRLTATNQPSLFTEKKMTINVVPYYTAALNSDAQKAEKDTFTLTGSGDKINVTFADEECFYVTNQSKLDEDIDNLCILAAVYDEDTQKIKNTVTTYKVHDITADGGTTLEIPVEGDAGDTVRLFVWRNITNLVPFVK